MATIKVSNVRPVPRVRLVDIDEGEKEKVRKDITILFSPTQLKRDIYYLKRVGMIKVQAIANQLGIDRKTLYRWMSGTYCPRNPYHMKLVNLWAEELRRQIAEQEQEPQQPFYIS